MLPERSCASDFLPNPLNDKIFCCDYNSIGTACPPGIKVISLVQHTSMWSNVLFAMLSVGFVPWWSVSSSPDSILLAIKLLGTRKHRLWWENYCYLVEVLLLCVFIVQHVLKQQMLFVLCDDHISPEDTLLLLVSQKAIKKNKAENTTAVSEWLNIIIIFLSFCLGEILCDTILLLYEHVSWHTWTSMFESFL